MLFTYFYSFKVQRPIRIGFKSRLQGNKLQRSCAMLLGGYGGLPSRKWAAGNDGREYNAVSWRHKCAEHAHTGDP